MEKGGEGREEERGREGGEGRGQEAFLVMWPRRLSALNPPHGQWSGHNGYGSLTETKKPRIQ